MDVKRKIVFAGTGCALDVHSCSFSSIKPAQAVEIVNVTVICHISDELNSILTSVKTVSLLHLSYISLKLKSSLLYWR